LNLGDTVMRVIFDCFESGENSLVKVLQMYVMAAWVLLFGGGSSLHTP
jgi:hypothetical protein